MSDSEKIEILKAALRECKAMCNFSEWSAIADIADEALQKTKEC